jgi:hypothetical protein
MRSLVFAVAGLIVGVGAHAAWSAADRQEMRREVQQAVRDGLRQEMPSAVRVVMAGGAIIPPPEVPETEENRQANAAEAALVDAAVRVGRWTDDDVFKLRAILPKMSVAGRPKALAGISKAINDGRFKVEAAVPF